MNEADRITIRKNTVALVEQMELDCVLDILHSRGTITQAQSEELMPVNKRERRNKVREFLGVITRRGPSAFSDLYDALLKTEQEHLAELLCPGKVLPSTKVKSDPEQLPASSAELTPSSEPLIHTALVNVTPATVLQYEQLLRNNKVYNMTTPRGRVLVINNEKFSSMSDGRNVLPDRNGTTCDVMNLNTLFNELQFDFYEEHNQTAQGMRNIIKAETNHVDHDSFGMFVLVILSHGENGAVYGVDGELLQISEIKQLLGSRHFQSMTGKPKLILLQACQGVKHEGRVTEDGPQTDAAPSATTAPRAEFADMLIAYPTAQGNVSYRDMNLGTWFIRAIVEVFRSNAWQDDIVSLLTEVRQQVHQVSVANGFVQGTFDEHHLYKKLYLLPGWPDALRH